MEMIMTDGNGRWLTLTGKLLNQFFAITLLLLFEIVRNPAF